MIIKLNVIFRPSLYPIIFFTMVIISLFSFSLFFFCRLLRAELQNLRRKGAIKQFQGPTGVRSYTTGTCSSYVRANSGSFGGGVGFVGGVSGGSLDRPLIDTNRTCARCRTELGRIINRGAPCRSCRDRVCKACREFSTRTTDWVCVMCHKKM